MIVPCNKKKFFQKLRSQGKSHSQLVNFSGARPFMKPLYMKSYMRYRPSQFAFLIVMVKWSLSVMKYVQKCPRNQSKKIQILGGDGINSKLKLRKAQYSILSLRFCVPYGRAVSRRIGMYARGDTGISSNSKKSSQNTLDSSRVLSKSLVCCTP